MPRDRSVRMLVAALVFVLALFLAMSYLVEGRGLVDWWLPLVLFIIGIAALVLDRSRSDEVADSAALASSAKVYAVREYTFADDRPAIALAGPEQAGEVNVHEPLDEQESEPTIAAPETLTPPAEPVEAAATPDVAPAAPETLTPAQTEDATRSEMPLQPHEVAKPEQTQAERLEDKGELLQPADTAENEFQDGEHVAANQPTQMPPTTTVTTGEGAGEGTEPMDPVQKEVLDATAAPSQPTDAHAIDPTQPDVADAVLNDRQDEATSEALAPSDRISAEPASGAGPDDLTLIAGIGGRMQTALHAAGYNNFTQLAAASDDELRAAIEAGGMRLAPTLSTWREQAGFLARGDRAGFEALRNALRGHTSDAEDDRS